MSKIETLARFGLSIVEVMATSIARGVQPLQYRRFPMWHYNGEDDASRCGRKGPDTSAALTKILVELYKGEKEEFSRINCRDGFSMYNPPSWVSSNPTTLLILLPKLVPMDINLSICNRNGEKSPRSLRALPHSHRTLTGTSTPDSKRIQIYLWTSRTGCFTRQAMMARKWLLSPTITVFFPPHM